MDDKNIKINYDIYSKRNIDPHSESWFTFGSFTSNKTILFIFELLSPDPEKKS